MLLGAAGEADSCKAVRTAKDIPGAERCDPAHLFDLFGCFFYYLHAHLDDVESVEHWSVVQDDPDACLASGFVVGVFKLYGSSDYTLIAAEWEDQEPSDDIPERWRVHYWYKVYHGTRDEMIRAAKNETLRSEMSNTGHGEPYRALLDTVGHF